MILIHSPYLGLGEDGRSPDVQAPSIAPHYRDLFDRAFKRGYSIVAVAVRGFGASEGCWDYFGPAHQADSVEVIRWAARQPWSTGKVGTYGGSADAFAQVAGFAQRLPEQAAAVIHAPMVDQYRVTYVNGVPWWDPPRGAADPELYGAFASYPPTLNALVHPDGAGPPLALPGATCYADSRAQALDTDPNTPFWRTRNLAPRASGNKVPTLWAQGFRDDRGNISPDSVQELYASQRGPKRLWYGQVWHVPTSDWQRAAGRGSQFIDEAFRWFDRHVKGVAARAAPTQNDPPDTASPILHHL